MTAPKNGFLERPSVYMRRLECAMTAFMHVNRTHKVTPRVNQWHMVDSGDVLAYSEIGTVASFSDKISFGPEVRELSYKNDDSIKFDVPFGGELPSTRSNSSIQVIPEETL
eukprot:989905_1